MKILFILVFKFLYTLGLLLGNVEAQIDSTKYPRIKVKESTYTTLTEIDSRNFIFTAQDRVAEAKIDCEASCPVQWFLRSYNYDTFPDELSNAITFKSRRSFKQFWNTSSYTFTASMMFRSTLNKLTGRYECKCVHERNSSRSSSIFVYWEGSSGHYLLQAGETRNIKIAKGDKRFKIYCGASKPQAPVYLYFAHNQSQVIPNNKTIFQDIEGFTLDVSIYDKLARNNEKVEFQCTKDLINSHPSRIFRRAELALYEIQRDDYKIATVELENFKHVSEESGGLVNYNYTNHDLTCCSQQLNHRQVGFYCRNHQHCRYRWFGLITGHNADERNQTCTWYHEGFGASDGAVVFRCERPKTEDEDGLQANAEKIYGLNSNSYLSLREAEQEKDNFIQLNFVEDTNETLYLGSDLTFQCKFSSYVFSEGVVWMVETRTGKQEIVTKDQSHSRFAIVDLNYDVENLVTLKIRVKSDQVLKLICFAPVYNSYEWWNSTLAVNQIGLNKPTIPQFKNPAREVVMHSQNEQVEISCDASGNPVPHLVWTKESETLENSTEYLILTSHPELQETTGENLFTVYSFLRFRMNANTSGKYTCKSSNVAGEAEKIFSVNFRSTGAGTTTIVVSTLIVIVLLLIILGFSLWKIRIQRKAILFLSRKEIEEFEKGNPEALAKSKSSNDYATNNLHHLLPYNTDFEVTKESLHVDHGVILGTGTYGMVLKGTLKTPVGSERPVAVKTIKPNEEASHFKILLCEVKIMAFIGAHENIVCLVGAFTRNIRNREILVATEFCENGNLLDFLRKNRQNFKNLFTPEKAQNLEDTSTDDYMNVPERHMSSYDLVKWTEDISKGMEYLATKRVIHGDLACRNVLLDANLVAKVGDFGLSKHLFQYTTYQKKTVQLLPWKWMALESLQDMEFSLQSDIWAFGVTTWEIFSLGQSPYPGLNWDGDFVRKLVDGYRLSQPEKSTNEVYAVIVSCWIKEQNRRPSFTDLKGLFHKLRMDLRGQVSPYQRQNLGLTNSHSGE